MKVCIISSWANVWTGPMDSQQGVWLGGLGTVSCLLPLHSGRSLAWTCLKASDTDCVLLSLCHKMSHNVKTWFTQYYPDLMCDTRMLFYTRYTTAIFYYTVIRMHVLLIGLLTWFLNKKSLPEIEQYVICYHLYVVIIFPIFPKGSITYKCSLVLALTQFNPLQKPCKSECLTSLVPPAFWGFSSISCSLSSS